MIDLIAIGELLFDAVKLTLYIAFGYLILIIYAKCTQSTWLLAVTAKQHSTLILLTAFLVGIKVFEDVLAMESGLFDASILLLIRQRIPADSFSFFNMMTVSASGIFLIPASFALGSLLFLMQYRREALLISATMAVASLVIFTLKVLIGRERPALWDTNWYWGSSFPSGHTLSTAAFSTASVLIVTRIWPRYRVIAMLIAVIWTNLVGLSRLVLGVHWPTDVLGAICVGIFIPLAIRTVVDLPHLRFAKHS